MTAPATPCIRPSATGRWPAARSRQARRWRWRPRCWRAALLLAAGNRTLLLLLALYVALNVAYSWRLKQVPVVDVSIIAAGFMLRLLAGTVAVGIPPSRWLLLTGIFVTLFLGFCKRKAESFHEEATQRAVMAHYPPALIDTFIAITMTATLTTYSLFATSPEAQLQHGERLLYTVPVVVFALLRYTYQVHRGRGEDVARDLLRDAWLLARRPAVAADLFEPPVLMPDADQRKDGAAAVKLPLKQLLLVLGVVATAYAAALLVWGEGPRTSLAGLWSLTGLQAAALCLLNYGLRGLRWRLVDGALWAPFWPAARPAPVPGGLCLHAHARQCRRGRARPDAGAPALGRAAKPGYFWRRAAGRSAVPAAAVPAGAGLGLEPGPAAAGAARGCRACWRPALLAALLVLGLLLRFRRALLQRFGWLQRSLALPARAPAGLVRPDAGRLGRAGRGGLADLPRHGRFAGACRRPPGFTPWPWWPAPCRPCRPGWAAPRRC